MFCREQRPLLPKNLRIPEGVALLSQMWEALFENEKTKFAVAAAALAAGTYIEPPPPPSMPPVPQHPSLPVAVRPAPVLPVARNPTVPQLAPQLATPHELARNPPAYAEPVSSEAVHVQLAARRGEVAAQMQEITAHRLSAGAPLGSVREISQAREVSSAPSFATAATAPVAAAREGYPPATAALAQMGEPQGAAPPPATSRHLSAGQQHAHPSNHAMCSAADSNPRPHLHPTTDQPLLASRHSPLATPPLAPRPSPSLASRHAPEPSPRPLL